MAILTLALKSLWNRRYTALLTLLSIALSVALLLGVERVRTEARQSFANTISGTDLVVGARSGSIQLLLYSVFRIGNATNNISWQSYREIAQRPEVAWTIPISLGDSHRGYRVMGTTIDYFEHYRYGRKQPLVMAEGRRFAELYDAVLGAEVAKELNYQLGQTIVLAHGAGDVSFVEHADKPFRVVGILKPTGTPVDRTVHVSLEAIEAIHSDGWMGGVPSLAVAAPDLTPRAITAFLVGLKSKTAVFRVQRFVNDYREEPLLAVLPGVVLQELWDAMGVAEQVLLAISGFVVLVGLTGMITVLLAGLRERRREMAILRALGARPGQVFLLLVCEAGSLALAGVMAGMALLYLLLFAIRPVIEAQFGLHLGLDAPSAHELTIAGLVVACGFAVGALPAWRAYRYALADGMTIRL